MSLICGEHSGAGKAVLAPTDEVFCVTTMQAPYFTAVCRAAIDAIPREERSTDRIANGVDIHFGHSIPNALPGSENNLSLRNLQLGERRFSVTRETAEQYLPQTLRRY